MSDITEHPDLSEVAIELSRQHGAYQIALMEEHGGYRLAGPKFDGTGDTIFAHRLNERDAIEIRAILDRVFPDSSQAEDLSRLRDALTDAIEERGMADAEATRLREERDALTHDRDQARDEADNWRQQAWMEGYPRDSGDRHPWETSDEYRDLLAAGWASPTPRISPEATS